MWWLRLVALRNLLAFVAAPIMQHSKAIGAWIVENFAPVHTVWKQQNILNGMSPDWDDATQSTINK